MSYLVRVLVSVFFFSEKAELGGVAAAKIKELTAELDAAGSKPFNPEERIRTGFIQFKNEKFEYVSLISLLSFSFIYPLPCHNRIRNLLGSNLLYYENRAH